MKVVAALAMLCFCVFVLGCTVLGLTAGSMDESVDPAPDPPARRAVDPPVSQADDRPEQHHCYSVWDEDYGGIEPMIRQDLSNPSTMETGQVRLGPLDATGSYHEIQVSFTAVNDFGSRVRLIAYGDVDAETCDVTYYGFDAAS